MGGIFVKPSGSTACTRIIDITYNLSEDLLDKNSEPSVS